MPVGANSKQTQRLFPNIRARTSFPVAYAPETTPIKYTTHLMDTPRFWWYNNLTPDFKPMYKERSWKQSWPHRTKGWEKGSTPILKKAYSKAALGEILKTMPDYFDVKDVPRPPQRIHAISNGIVDRWYTNYWTLHSIKYQCMLAQLPWTHNERFRPRTNYDEPFWFVDFEETKSLRDQRSKWINANRSLVGMTKKIREVEEENRYVTFRKSNEKFWSNRKIFIARVKSMNDQGMLDSSGGVTVLPVKTFNLNALLKEE